VDERVGAPDPSLQPCTTFGPREVGFARSALLGDSFPVRAAPHDAQLTSSSTWSFSPPLAHEKVAVVPLPTLPSWHFQDPTV